LGDAGDIRANAMLLKRLRAERPGDAVLSEEAHDDLKRLQADRVWIIDPLDGTWEYSLPYRDDWAVHVALWQRTSGAEGVMVHEPSALTIAVPTRLAPSKSRIVEPGSPVPLIGGWALSVGPEGVVKIGAFGGVVSIVTASGVLWAD
jgi:hypothetical protein